jgi:23S rRNA (pseudouridine1915-N3)-methyltransferase
MLLSMQLTLAYVGSSPGRKDACEELIRSYLERCSSFAHCVEMPFRSEKALLDWLARRRARTPVVPVLLDSRGRQMSSEALAAWVGSRRDEGDQHLLFAVGPADGWSEEARGQARLLLSLGPMTLAHALARVVVAEQLYRTFTILSGHPYHKGH